MSDEKLNVNKMSDKVRFSILCLILQDAAPTLGISYVPTPLICLIDKYAQDPDADVHDLFLFIHGHGYRARELSVRPRIATSVEEAQKHLSKLIKVEEEERKEREKDGVKEVINYNWRERTQENRNIIIMNKPVYGRFSNYLNSEDEKDDENEEEDEENDENEDGDENDEKDDDEDEDEKDDDDEKGDEEENNEEKGEIRVGDTHVAAKNNFHIYDLWEKYMQQLYEPRDLNVESMYHLRIGKNFSQVSFGMEREYGEGN